MGVAGTINILNSKFPPFVAEPPVLVKKCMIRESRFRDTFSFQVTQMSWAKYYTTRRK